jgi:hypothetical protein
VRLGEGFENDMRVAEEKRQQGSAAATIQSKSDLNDIKQQLADVATMRESDQKGQALAKLQQDLELRSKTLDLKQMSLDQQRQLSELSNQLKEQKLENDRQRFSVGTDAKSLEDERKARLTSIENDWKQHPYWNKLTGDKNKEVQAVNDDINQRLAGVRATSGPSPAAAPGATTGPAKGYVRIKASDGGTHDIPSGKVQAAKQRDPKLTIISGQ